MDPVSAVLAEQERRPQRFMPFVVLAVALHMAVASIAFVVGRAAPHRPVKLPAVSVRIVRPQLPGPPAGTAPARPAERPAAKPKPSPPPKPRTTPAPKASPVSRSERRASSEQAMPATRTTPVAAPEPAPTGGGAGTGAGGGGRGLSVGGSGANGIPGVPEDFQFNFYIERMLALIESVWYRPPASGAARARVRFTIARNGRVDGIQLEESSGVPTFDRAALRALYAANPLPPLPPAYGQPSLTVHLTFAE